jgi:aspartyl-tRNA(Asn)/glutamyl-tRNA(Gln) amidotransferase subunit C
MKITQKEVQYVAGLANLELTDVERVRMEKDLNTILDYIDQLSELDTANVEPMAQIAQIASSTTGPADAFRPDVPSECLPRQEALQDAPQSDGTFFRVPKVIER